MYWRLLPTLNACIASGRVILLDIEHDRYSALPSEVTGPAVAWLRAGDGSPAPEVLARLLRVTLGEGQVAAPIGNQATELVTVSATISAQDGFGRTGFASGLFVFLIVTSTWIGLRTRKLHAILSSRVRLRAKGRRLDLPALRNRARVFASVRRWCPIRPNCLLDSLAFDRWLGCPTDNSLVFGVVAHPFEAHCWVQSNGNVLNDSYDRVSRFEPILSV
ncbi:MAG: hypothetical protein JWR80_8608 [Bradyrhizobium sp.]|nr:hypothetical protein [Bradyrhizobium sp.]